MKFYQEYAAIAAEKLTAERDDLNDKLSKLLCFMNSHQFSNDIDNEERTRLLRQGLAMQQYLSILNERIIALAKIKKEHGQ